MEHLDSEIYRLLRQINGRMNTMIHEVFAPVKVTPVQAMILSHIHEKGSLRLSELAEHLRMTNSNCSMICQRLEKSGLIIRQRDCVDQRAVNLMLTEKALAMSELIHHHIHEPERLMLKEASEEEMLKIYEGLVLLDRYLDKEKGQVKL